MTKHIFKITGLLLLCAFHLACRESVLAQSTLPSSDSPTALPKVSLSLSTETVTRAEKTVFVRLTLRSDARTSQHRTFYFKTAGTAVAGVDYDMPSSLTIPSGKTNISASISILPDGGTFKAPQALSITLTSSKDLAVDEMAPSVELTILDLPPSAQLLADKGELNEYDTMGRVTYTVQLNKAYPTDTSVRLGLAGTATVDALCTDACLFDEQSRPVSDAITIPAGKTSANFFARVSDDSKIEGHETMDLTLSPLAPLLPGNPISTSLKIVDNDQARIQVIPKDALNASEGGPDKTFTFKLTNARGAATTLERDLSFGLALRPESTASPSDVVTPASITIPAGLSSVEATFMAAQDTVGENAELAVFDLVLSPSDQERILLGSNGAFQFHIEDDDGISVSLVGQVTNPMEKPHTATGRVNYGSFELERRGPIETPLTVDLAIDHAGINETVGKALEGIDFATIPKQVVIPAGQSKAKVDFNIIDDGFLENTEQFRLSILSSPLYFLGATRNLLFTVSDDLSSSGQNADANPFTRSIFVTATSNAGGILLSWEDDDPNTSYSVFRREAYSPTLSWGSPLATLDLGVRQYQDGDVRPGVIYEYQVSRPSGAKGFLYAIKEAPPIHARGKALLVIDKTIENEIAPEILRFRKDLAGDGWETLTLPVERTLAAKQVKKQILDQKTLNPTISSIIIIGHVAVPYSGKIAPDGHYSNHLGAWPTDSYYGDVDESLWTDSLIDHTLSTSPRHSNVPGDGKFDQSTFPSDLEMSVGRIDFTNLPAFAPLTEVDLLKRYFARNHGYRQRSFAVPQTAFLDDPWWDFNGESIATSLLKSLGSLVGRKNIKRDTYYFSELQFTPHLWTFAGGGGSYNSMVGLKNDATDSRGYTADFAASKNLGVFNSCFGSYFGDYDSKDNILRGMVAADGYGLTNVWTGRPYWYFHNMAIGEPIGESLKLSVNKSSLYPGNLFPRSIHLNIFGDPTLRQAVLAPPTALQAVIEGTTAELSWQASADANVAGYHVYLSQSEFGPYTLVQEALVTGTSFKLDLSSQATGSRIFIQVRAYRMENSMAGTWGNLSAAAQTAVVAP